MNQLKPSKARQAARRAARTHVAKATAMDYAGLLERNGFERTSPISGHVTFSRGNEAVLLDGPKWTYAERKSIHFEPKMEGTSLREMKDFLPLVKPVQGKKISRRRI